METLILVLAIGAGVVLLALAMWYVEVAMVLFLTAPLVKLAIMAAVPIAREWDYTGLVLILLACSSAFYILRKGMGESKLFLGFFGMLAVIVAILGVSYIYSPSTVDAPDKLKKIAIILPMSLMIPILYLKNEKQARRLGFWTALIGFLVALGTVVSPTASIQGSESRGTFLESSSLETASTIVYGVIFALVLGFDKAIIKRYRICFLLSLPVMLLGLFYTGSRGPLLGLGVCVVLFMWFNRRDLGLTGTVGIIMALCVCGVLVVAFLPEAYWRRFALMLGSDKDVSFGEDRFALWRVAWSEGWQKPFLGHGISSFGFAAGKGDSRYYPHNMFLELFYEGGILPTLVAMVLVIMTIFKMNSLLKFLKGSYLYPMALGFVLALTSSFLDALKSGDLSDNRRMWFWLGCALGMFNVANNLLARQRDAEALEYQGALQGAGPG